MIHTAYINIWSERAGAVAWDSNSGIATFEYSNSFIANKLDLAPITMSVRGAENKIFSFPQLAKSETYHGLPGLLADVLPDKFGNALINAWLARQGRSQNSMNPAEMLCYIGNRAMGALEFEPVHESKNDIATKLQIEDLVSIVQDVLNQKLDFSTKLAGDEEKALMDILRVGTSAGGARAKALISFNEKTKEVRSGQTTAPRGFSHWLLKFDGVDDQQLGSSKGYGRVEFAYYLMAKDCGITMMESRLLEEQDRAHFMTRRFDRVGSKGKIHVQSLCAIAHMDFNDIHSYSYEQVFQVMRMLHLTYPEAEQMFRRMVFNVLSRNCDDHTKNFAFMMDTKGRWNLAPAFDMCHSYRPSSQWVSQQSLSVNGKRKNITHDDLLEVMKHTKIKNTNKILDQISEVISNWEKYADSAGVENSMKKAIKKTLLV